MGNFCNRGFVHSGRVLDVGSCGMRWLIAFMAVAISALTITTVGFKMESDRRLATIEQLHATYDEQGVLIAGLMQALSKEVRMAVVLENWKSKRKGE